MRIALLRACFHSAFPRKHVRRRVSFGGFPSLRSGVRRHQDRESSPTRGALPTLFTTQLPSSLSPGARPLQACTNSSPTAVVAASRSRRCVRYSSPVVSVVDQRARKSDGDDHGRYDLRLSATEGPCCRRRRRSRSIRADPSAMHRWSAEGALMLPVFAVRPGPKDTV